ncbi:cell surface glycoprotein MUC18 isoform X2 [Clupea harengus]|uniref:Cell surface glycoprotein MUC18 isoform X2 n=1 Tax=Clupea harengus TaxID=7950 RepID=A0A6P8FG68_CLUHA|nr:cell surface glycoprotein MUC18 isoform X2 [Clupea harengus]
MACRKDTLLLVALLSFVTFYVRAKVDIDMDDTVSVYRGDPAELHCRYSFSEEPSMMMVQWFVKYPNGSRERISYRDLTIERVDEGTDYTDRITVAGDSNSETLTVLTVKLSDEREFFCQVNGMAAGNGERKTHLAVFDPPEAPVIEGVHSGISVSSHLLSKIASCEARKGYPRPNITWYRDETPLIPINGEINVVTLVTREASGFYTVQSELQYKITKEDKDALFSCKVSYFVPGDVRTSASQDINITVHYPTTNVELWRELPKGLVKEGDTVEIRCQGDGNPPPPYTFNREQQPEIELDSTNGQLVLHEVTRRDSGVYQCRTLDLDTEEDVVGNMHLTVHYLDPAVVVPKDSEVMSKGESLTATCNALSSLNTSTVWFKDDREIGRGHMLFLEDATFDTAGEYVCEVSVPTLAGFQSTGSVHIIVQGVPKIKDAENVDMEERAGKWVNLSCEARGYPRPIIAWSIYGTQSWREVLNRVTEDSVQSLVTLKVTSDITAICNATNDMGVETKTHSIKSMSMVTPAAKFQEGSGIIIVIIIICILLLAILGSVLYFLYKKGKLPCGRSGKQEIINVYSTAEKPNKEDIVVEMKAEKTEEAVLLKGVNGDKKPMNDQYIDLRK